MLEERLEENVHSKDWEEGFYRGLARGHSSAGILIQQYIGQLKDYYKPDKVTLDLLDLLEERIELVKHCLDS